MAIEIFNRYEHKYKMNPETFNKVIEVMNKHMELDNHCANHSLYTIANIYYDTPDNSLIRESLSKPIYKEKMRLRAYGVPDKNTNVFLEIKKKFNGLVNKRRTTLKLDEAYDFIQSGRPPEINEYMNEQVIHELEYFMKLYNLSPKVYIAYDRLAYFEKGNDDLRISFDNNIRSRRYDVALEKGDYGTKLISDNIRLMEIKTSRAMPMWLCKMLSDFNLRKVSFSKYGTEYRNMLRSAPNNTYYFITTKPINVNSI